MKMLALATLRIYKSAVSPYLPGLCRHIPTCSEYAYEAIDKYGVLRGIWLGGRRLINCRPMGTKGHSPLP